MIKFSGIARSPLAGKKIIRKAGCLVIVPLGEEMLTSGIYLFLEGVVGSAGLPYAGQSVDIARRLREHVGKKLDNIEDILGALKINVEDVKETRDLVEQWFIDSLRDDGHLPTNERNAISKKSKKRKPLNKALEKAKACK